MREYSYSYHLPEDLIAKTPQSPRDASRLFIYHTGEDRVLFDRFANIHKYLPPKAHLVFNDTKVVPARAVLRKATGGKIEALFLVNEWTGRGPIPALLQKKAEVGATLFLEPKKPLKVIGHDKTIFFLKPLFPSRDIYAILARVGHAPVPKYIKGITLGERVLQKRYQSIFAKQPASVAAPTASLHFTDRLLDKLKKNGIQQTFLTLHVGLGTFSPVSPLNFKSGALHSECFSIPRSTITRIRKAKIEHHPVIAVGTTTARALESAHARILSPRFQKTFPIKRKYSFDRLTLFVSSTD